MKSSLSLSRFIHQILKSLRFNLVIIFGIWIVPTSVSAQSPDSMKVLILNSYHQGYQWTDEIMAAIRSEFDNSNNVELFIEYMDTKHYYSLEYFEMLDNLYAYKYANKKIDLVIIADNFALDFIRMYRDKLFSAVPVVFCGIDKFDASVNKNFSGITGVIEDYDLKQTLDLALELHPTARNIAIVVDSTSNSIVDIERFRSLTPHYQKKYNIIELLDWSWQELSERLNNLPENTIVIRLSCTKSFDNVIMSKNELAEFWGRYCRFPTYTSMGHKVENGVLGGVITTGKLQALAAVAIAKRILGGEPVNEIPILYNSPSLPIFDYYQMKQFRIKEDDIPANSLIINQPFSFYRQYKYMVWSISAVITCLTGLVGFLLINIIRRRQAEQELRNSEERFRQLSDIAEEGIMFHNNFSIYDVNRAMTSLFGYEQSELKGMHLRQLVSRESWVTIKEKQATGNNTKPYEIVGLKKDGSAIICQMVDKCYNNQEKKFRVSSFIDITKRKQAEQEAKLWQDQLIQADKMAALGTLVAGIAHEINNPNNLIMLNIPILNRTWNSIAPILHEYYEKNGDFSIAGFKYTRMTTEFTKICSAILEGSQRIKAIVADLKKYSSINEDGTTELVDIKAMLSSAINLLSNNIKKYTNHFQADFGENIPPVKGNFQHFEQVVINLIQNSCQALSEKNKAVYVACSYRELDHEVVITIQDEGVGIPQKNLSRIFDPFFTTKRDIGGMGLGLSVSQSIIKKYNGSLQFSSKSGKGTTARIILPVEDQGK